MGVCGCVCNCVCVCEVSFTVIFITLQNYEIVDILFLVFSSGGGGHLKFMVLTVKLNFFGHIVQDDAEGILCTVPGILQFSPGLQPPRQHLTGQCCLIS